MGRNRNKVKPRLPLHDFHLEPSSVASAYAYAYASTSTASVPKLTEIAAKVALETQCRRYKDSEILIDIISRECGWQICSLPV